MVRIPGMSWLMRLNRKRAQGQAGLDLADMGTCVGLDATYDAGLAQAAARDPSHAPPRAAGDAPRTLGSGWAEDRLNGRSVL